MTNEFLLYEKLIEKILHYFAGPQMLNELLQAKKEFFDNGGTLDESAENYEVRMSQFYDWYFFTRELKSYDHTPLNSCHLVRELRFSPEEESAITVLKKFRHSIFELIKIKNNDIYIKDLFKNEKLVIKNVHNTHGFDADELFAVRLISIEGNWHFTKGFCFHPVEAKKFILNEIKKHRKNPDLDPDLLMLRLIKMKYKFEQYRHVSADMIYSEKNILKL